MKKLIAAGILCALPAMAMANMNGSHASLDRAIEIMLLGLVVLTANFVLCIVNISWKNKALMIVNSVLCLPLVAGIAYFFEFNLEAAGFLTLLLAIQCLFIWKSYKV